MDYDREIERYRKSREKTRISIDACKRLISQKDPKLGAKLGKLISKYISSPTKKRPAIMSKITKLISKVKMKSNFIVDSTTVRNLFDSYSTLESEDKRRLASRIDNPLDDLTNYLHEYNSDDILIRDAEERKSKEPKKDETRRTMTPIERANTRASETYSRTYNPISSPVSIPTPTNNYGGSSYLQRDVPREQIGGGVSIDPNFDSAYKALDQHGLPNTQIGGGVSMDSDFDAVYRALDQHGLPNTELGGRVSIDPDFDSAYKDIDQHGLPNTQIGGGLSIDPDFDSAYKDVDQHGMTGVDDGSRRAALDKEMEYEQKLVDYCQLVISAEEITNEMYEQLYSFPDKSIKSIIRGRYIKSTQNIENASSDKKTDLRIAQDLDFINTMLSDRNLFNKDINVSTEFQGIDYKNIFDILDEYEKRISSSDLQFKESLLQIVQKVKKKAEAMAEEASYSKSARTM